MKATGIVRRVDDLGRISIPRDVRRALGIHEEEPLEVYTDAEKGMVGFRRYCVLDLPAVKIQKAIDKLEITGFVVDHHGKCIAGKAQVELPDDFKVSETPYISPILPEWSFLPIVLNDEVFNEVVGGIIYKDPDGQATSLLRGIREMVILNMDRE